MSCQITYSRQVLQRVSDRKKRKLAIDDSDKISNRNLDLFVDSQLKVIEDSQTSLKEHRDLFGELIPQDELASNAETKNKSTKKTPVSKKKKQPGEKITIDSPVIRPKRVFIPTPKFMKLMEEAQTELYSLMGINKSSSDVSVVTTDSLDVSGIQDLQDSPIKSIRNESKTNLKNNDNDKESRQILKGVVAFVDYKIDKDRSDSSITQCLIDLGAKVEKTFNQKVTHVMFCDGLRSTYNKAIKRNIPLVSARWMEYSKLANKMLDPLDYPPVDMEKYTKTPTTNINIPVSKTYKKFLRPSNIERDQIFKSNCDNLMERFNNFNMNLNNENKENSPIIETEENGPIIETEKNSLIIETEENGPIIETPKKSTVNKLVDPYKTNDVVNILSDQLCKVLNKIDSPVPDDQIEDLYIPMSIKVLRKYLTPNGKENTTYTELDSELAKIEERLNLNFQARQRFRKLLFPSDKNLYNTSTVSDFPSPSPEKLRISAPSRLISTRKRKTMLGDKSLSNTKNINSNKKTPTQNNVKMNSLKWQIPSDLRPKKTKKICVQKGKSIKTTQTKDTVSSMMSRNSSTIFQTPKTSLASPVISQSIACSGMTKRETNILKSSIQDLGTFIFHNKVEPSTNFLITKPRPNRTLNIVFAMAYGCFIVSENWVHESHKIGRWLSHEQYLISDLSERVKEFQIRRHTFGSLLTFHIFDNAGRIYISDTCDPPSKVLRRLVRACGGHCTSTVTKADVVVGFTPQINNNIHEKWILDCITQGILLNKNQYTMIVNTSDIMI
uniref:Microcephalin n=1 Tax=Melanaphis sacchari TaxID=742174 RepID=A0A2H8TMI7_9HEMI